MHRFYIAPEDWNPHALALTKAEAHHVRDVLRLKQGDKVIVFNGRGREVTAEISVPGRGEIQLRKLSESDTPPLRCRIALAQAIPKGKNMELIVQKAVEIGASEIFPLISERTIVDLDPAEAAHKQAKWQTVAIEAAKQCGQNWLPQVHRPQKLKTFFEQGATASRCQSGSDPLRVIDKSLWLGFDLRLIGSLQPGAMHLKKILADYCDEHRLRQPSRAGRLPERVLMLIGPEGDFTPAEIALARTHGCLPITLGPIVLRVETAAIYCLSVLSYELLQDSQSG